MRNKAKNFPAPRKIAHPRAKTTAIHQNRSINMDPMGKTFDNR